MHGHRIEAVLYLFNDDVGIVSLTWSTRVILRKISDLAGQWDAVLIADDSKEFVWQLESLRPRPKSNWIARESL